MKYLLITFCLFTLVSCKAQKTSLMYPKVTNDFETFDENFYNEIGLVNQSFKRVFLEDNSYVEMHVSKNGKGTYLTPEDSYFTLIKSYYHNGNIKEKGLYFNVDWGGFEKGVWYEFSENGKLVNKVNYDDGYDFTFENILLFCKKERIHLAKGPILQSTGYHTIIKRDKDSEGRLYWEIEYLKPSGDELETIILDGKTGKIINKSTQEYINN